MEHFEQNRAPVKEKSVYVLHLDTTRILIIGTVAIGIIALAYFGGSYSLKQKEAKPKLAAKSHLMFPSDSMSMPSAPHSGEMASLFNNRTSDNLRLPEENRVMDFTSNRPSEIAALDDTKIVLPTTPSRVAPQPAPKPQVKAPTAKAPAPKPQNTRSQDAKVERPAPVKSPNVVEVSAPLPKTQSGFAIQVGSFAVESRAKKLVSALKTEDYNAYIEHIKFNGKDSFRVKIGPISNKKEAISMLNELQEDDRFADCYIVSPK